MMKARSQRAGAGDGGPASSGSSRGAKADALGANGPSGTAASQSAAQSAAQARKRRSSINVYDQPSSLNSRLRQLETDMLRLDEDRTKLFDDTHSALAQYELKLGEIHAILKSRQDNVEKYVEDMRTLLLAKDEFEKQTKLLNEKHDRIHEKFMHRETIISREIKLLKNKFEVLEKNRQFRTMLQKSNIAVSGVGGGSGADNATTSDDLTSNLDAGSSTALDGFPSRNRSDTGTMSGLDSTGGAGAGNSGGGGGKQDLGAINKLSSLISGGGGGGGARGNRKNVRIKMSNFGGGLSSLLVPLFGFNKKDKGASRARRKSNKVSSISDVATGGGGGGAAGDNCLLVGTPATGAIVDPSEQLLRNAADGISATSPTGEQQQQQQQTQPASALPSESLNDNGDANAAKAAALLSVGLDNAASHHNQVAKKPSFFSRLFKGK